MRLQDNYVHILTDVLFHTLLQVTVIVLASVIHRCTSERTKPEPSVTDSTGISSTDGNSDVNDQ